MFKRFFIMFFLALLITFPSICIEGAKEGLVLWAITLVPTLLPFFIATKFLLQQSIPSTFLSPYLIFVGLFCGYPTATTILHQLYEDAYYDKKQAELFLCLCNHTSPAFLISFVYQNYIHEHLPILAFLLPIYGSIFLWMFFFLLFFGIPKNKKQALSSMRGEEKKLEDIFTDSIMTILKIGCYMILFSIFIALSKHLFQKNTSLLFSIFPCFLEITNGVHTLSSLALPINTKTALIGALCSFGGCCSIAQIKSVCPRELSFLPYYAFKLCTSVQVFLIFFLMNYP